MAGAGDQTPVDDRSGRSPIWEWIASPAGAVVAAAITIAIVGLVALTGGEDDEAGSTAQTVNPPDPIPASELASLSESLGAPVYWAGPQGAEEFYLARQGEDRIVVSYPARPGADPSQGTLTVATYRLDDAEQAIRRAAEGETARLHSIEGGIAVSDDARPTNVYFAYTDEPYQIEVFDPKPGRALELVLGGEVKPVR
jgi:hypothetical protein